MAENINLATFDFDVTRLEASLNTLQDSFIKLKKENEGYDNQLKATKQATLELTKEQLKLAASGDDTSEAFDENKKAIEQLNQVEAQLIKNQMNVATNMSRVKGEINQTNNQLKAYMNSQGQFNTLQEAANKALTAEIKNKNDAKAANIELNRVSNQLNPNIKEEADLLKQVNAQMDKNTQFIKDNSSESAKQKMNVGNYTQSIKDALGELGGFNGALGNTERALSAISPLFGSLKAEAQAAFDQIRGGTVATEGLTKAQAAGAVATNVASGAMKLLRVALISTGIGAIVVALGSLVAYLTTTQAGADKLSAALAPLKAIFSAIMGVVSELGGALVDAFSNPKKALADLGNFVKQNLINRFTAFGEILDGIINLDFQKVADGAIQAATGVEGMTGKIQAGAAATSKFLADSAAKGAEIDRINKEIAKSTLAYMEAEIAIGDQLDANELIIKNTAKSFSERAKAAEANIALTEKQGQAEADILKLKYQELKLQQELKGLQNLSYDDKVKERELLKEIDTAEDRSKEKRLEYSRVLSGLEKERREAAKKAADDALKADLERSRVAIEAMQTELAFYIQSQGIRKKSMSDQMAINKSIMEQQVEIAKMEADLAIKQADNDIKNVRDREAKKAQIIREFQVKQLESENEFMAQTRDLAMENAEIEFQQFLLNNQRKLDQNQYFNDEMLAMELDRLNRISEQEAALQTQRFADGLISLEEYNLAIAEIDDKYRVAAEEAQAERDDAKKTKEAADLAIEDELNAQRYEVDLVAAQARLQKQQDLEIENAKKTGADLIALKKLHAKQDKELEQAVNNNKLELASSTFSNLATIFGKETAAGKAAAVAQTTIDTYKGATSAFTSLSGIPFVGPILGGIAAAAAVASGLANVKKIVSTKEPKIDTGGIKRPSYARGVIGLTGAGSGTSDSIDAKLSNGESVITARATSMFPNLLSDINQAGGGVGLDGRMGNTSNTLLQDGFNQRTDTAQATSAMAEAVYEAARLGTMDGSQKGIGDLADNRQIMNDAKF